MPKVSICIPAYRNPEGITRLLASVREQRFGDYEVVLTDDSPDGSVEAAARQAGLENLRYYRNETRKGAAANWNRAVELARGDYIKMMHHDDWFAGPDGLGRFAALLDEAPEAVLAFSGSWQTALGPEAQAELASQREAAAKNGTLGTGEASASAASAGTPKPHTGSPAGAGGGRGTGSDPEPLPDRFARHISAEKLALLRADWRSLFLGNVIGAPSAVIWRRTDQRFAEELTWLVDAEFYMRLLQKAEADGAAAFRKGTADPAAADAAGTAGRPRGMGAPGFAYTEAPLVCIGVSRGQLTRECREDGALNVREYGYLYREFSLGEGPDGAAYREQLLDIALQYGQPYAALEPYGIEKAAYEAARRSKRASDLRFYLGVAKRKLLGRNGTGNGTVRDAGRKN